MIYMKKVRFSSNLVARVRHREPPDTARAQPCDWSRAILDGNIINIFGHEKRNFVSSNVLFRIYINTTEMPNHFTYTYIFFSAKGALILFCSHSNSDLFMCEDNMSFSHVDIPCFPFAVIFKILVLLQLFLCYYLFREAICQIIVVYHASTAVKESLWWKSVCQNKTLIARNFQKVHALPLLLILTLKNQLLGPSALKEVLYML